MHTTPDKSPVVLRPAQPVPRLLTDTHAPQGTRRPQNRRTRHPFVTFVFVVGGACVLVVGGIISLGFLVSLGEDARVSQPPLAAYYSNNAEVCREANQWEREVLRKVREAGGEFSATLIPPGIPRRAAPKGFGPIDFGMRTREIRARFFGPLGSFADGRSLGVPGVSSAEINDMTDINKTEELVEKITVSYEEFPLPATDFYRAYIDTYGPPTQLGDLVKRYPSVDQTVRWSWPDDAVTVVIHTTLNDLKQSGVKTWRFKSELTLERGQIARERAERKAREDAERQRAADRVAAAKGLRSQKTP